MSGDHNQYAFISTSPSTVPREKLGMTREEAERYAVTAGRKRMWVVEWSKCHDKTLSDEITSGIVLNTVFNSKEEAIRLMQALEQFCDVLYSFHIQEMEAV